MRVSTYVFPASGSPNKKAGVTPPPLRLATYIDDILARHDDPLGISHDW
ncbi:hypothetical protein ACH41C_09285 [Streptomyces althioticus]